MNNTECDFHLALYCATMSGVWSASGEENAHIAAVLFGAVGAAVLLGMLWRRAK